MFGISATLLFVIGILVVIIVEVIKAIGKKRNVLFDKFWVSAILLVLSICLAFIFFPFTLPAWSTVSDLPTFQNYAQNLIPVVMTILGFAFLIYNLIVSQLKGRITSWLNGGDIEPISEPDITNDQKIG